MGGLPRRTKGCRHQCMDLAQSKSRPRNSVPKNTCHEVLYPVALMFPTVGHFISSELCKTCPKFCSKPPKKTLTECPENVLMAELNCLSPIHGQVNTGCRRI